MTFTGKKLYLNHVSILRCPLFCRWGALNNDAGREKVIMVSKRGNEFASVKISATFTLSFAEASTEEPSPDDVASAAQPCTNAAKQTMGIMCFRNSFIICKQRYTDYLNFTLFLIGHFVKFAFFKRNSIIGNLMIKTIYNNTR